MGKKRSEHYSWFNSSKNPNPSKKNKNQKWWKKPLKIAKLVTYTTLFSFSLVGCAQSFVIQSNKETGSGLEFYTSKEKVAPHVVTLSESDMYKGQKTIVTNSERANYWVQDQNVLSSLRTQGVKLGTWRSKTQSLRIVNKNQQSVTGSVLAKVGANNTYLAANDKDSSYNIKEKDSIVLPSIVDKTGNLADLVKKNANWPKSVGNDSFIFPDTKTTIGTTKTEAGSSIEKKFALDSYGYLANKYLNKIPALPKAGSPVSNEWKSWITSYSVIAQTTGWINQYTQDKKDKTKGTNKFTYVTSKKTPPLLSFEAVKPQRAIYSWSGAWHLGPFYALFVYPLAFLTGKLIHGMPNLNGWEAIFAIMIVVILVRSIAYALSFKSTLQSVKQQEVQTKVAIINAKYEPYKGNKQMDRRKQQEVSELYKREGVSAFGAFSQIFVTMPLFLSMWRVIGSMPSLKSTMWLGINFAATSYQELFKGAWQYLPLMAITASIQALQAITPRLFSKRREKNRVNIYQKEAMKKSNKTQNIMVAVFVFMALVLSAGLQVYWFFTGLFTIGQNVANHYIIKHQSKKRKRKTEY